MAVLAVIQTVGYGVLSYAFTVLPTAIAADLRTTTAVVTGARVADSSARVWRGGA